MLVINVGWEGGELPSQPSEFDRDFYVDYLTNHFNEWYAKLAPGFTTPWQVSNGGSYMIPAPPIPIHAGPFDPPKGCAFSELKEMFESIADSAESKARARGINPDEYAVVVVHWREHVCFGGIQLGRRIGLTRPVFAMHEFGHYLGLGHANTLRCTDVGGNLVPLSANCGVLDEYGDHYSAMGDTYPERAYGAIDTNRLGWLAGRFASVSAGDFTRTFTLKPYTDPTHFQRALRLQDGPTTLWLEYRTAIGVDHEDFTGLRFHDVQGVVVHREIQVDGQPRSQLLDMTPGSKKSMTNPGEDFDDAPLKVGQKWINPLGEMSITVSNMDANSATVTISSQRVAVPRVVDRSKDAAIAAIQAAGLTYSGATIVNDPSCDFINKVISQTPAAESRVMPKTGVSLKIGKRDTSRPCP